MKAFLAACIVIVAVSLIAGFGLEAIQATSGEAQTGSDVRLN